MGVKLIKGELCFIRISLVPAEIVPLVELRDQSYPNVQIIEAQASVLIEGHFEPSACRSFVKEVLEWGRGHRNRDRFLKKNSASELRDALTEAHSALMKSDAVGAVERMQKLKRLGQSFASKIARFLAPDKAVILDSVIRNNLGYAETSAGYEAFLDDCHTVLKASRKDFPHLRVSDVEAAIFAKLKGYKPDEA